MEAKIWIFYVLFGLFVVYELVRDYRRGCKCDEIRDRLLSESEKKSADTVAWYKIWETCCKK